MAVPRMLKDDIISTAGGFMGIGSTKVVTTVVLEKNIFCLGESIRVKLKCDNTSSKSDVKSFKIKLKRKVDLWAEAGKQ